MCILCIQGKPQDHSESPSGSQLGRRDFLKASTATAAAAGMSPFAPRPPPAPDDDGPGGTRKRGPRHVIPGGPAMSMDPKNRDFARAHGLVGGQKIPPIGA